MKLGYLIKLFVIYDMREITEMENMRSIIIKENTCTAVVLSHVLLCMYIFCDHGGMVIIRQPSMICLAYAAVLSLHVLVNKKDAFTTTRSVDTFYLFHILQTVMAIMIAHKACLLCINKH